VLEVMSTSVDTGLNPFKFIRKYFLLIRLVWHLNRNLTTDYSERTAQFNGNFDTDNQVYVP
jgi:hypothetical protein